MKYSKVTRSNEHIYYLQKMAFTLAEVLITLGIIGVVAAITIPGLINNYKAARLRSQFLKSYSTVQQVFRQMENDDEVSTDPADYDRQSTLFYKTFAKYLTGVLDCGTYTTKNKPCYASRTDETLEPYKTLDGNHKVSTSYFDDGQLALQDGTLLIVDHPSSNAWLWVQVDLNGYNNPPNRWGYDLFTFEFLDGELRTMGDTETTYNDLDKYCNLDVSNKYNGIACAHYAKVNSDYFKNIVKKVK